MFFVFVNWLFSKTTGKSPNVSGPKCALVEYLFGAVIGICPDPYDFELIQKKLQECLKVAIFRMLLKAQQNSMMARKPGILI